MQPHQERVIVEREALEDKREKLAIFIRSSVYASLPDVEKAALSRQFAAMGEYSQALQDRIVLWLK
jgi:hypothetical protein